MESDPSLANLQSEPEWSGLLDLAQRTATPCAFNPQKQVFSAFQGNWQVFDGFGNLFAHSSFSPALGSCVWVETFSAHYAKTEWTIYWSADDQGKVFQAWFTDKGRQGRMVGESDQPWRFMETRANAKGEDQCNCMEVSTNPDDSLLMISFLGEGPCSSKSTFKETGRMIYRRDPSGSQEKTK
ncbi:MAG: hypothetical protein KDC71_05910 [Acidobacteria bacterium]|nr:hypothetical protein [Acidobacteriota bacterium]